MKKKVLVITNAFPPIKGSGIQRIKRFLSYLPDIGYEPTILSTLPSFEIYHKEFDEAEKFDIIRSKWKPYREYLKKREFLIKTKNSPTMINKRSQHNNLKNMFYWLFYNFIEFPDSANSWINPALRAGKEFLDNNSINLIFSSSPDVSSHFIARKLSKKYNLPWVLEFRDLWVENPWNIKKASSIRKLFEKIANNIMLNDAHAIILVSENLIEILENQTSIDISKKIFIVPNGFDKKEYFPHKIYNKNQLPLKLVHTGSFYSGRRDISPIFEALSQLVKKKIINKSDIILLVAGDNEKHTLGVAEKYNLSSIVNDLGYLRSEESIKLQQSADILLLIEAVNYDKWTSANIPGKIYEYLGAAKPILAIADKDSSIADIIKTTNTGFVFEPSENNHLQNYLASQISDLHNNININYQPNSQEIGIYDWENIIKIYVDIFKFVENQTLNNN